MNYDLDALEALDKAVNPGKWHVGKNIDGVYSGTDTLVCVGSLEVVGPRQIGRPHVPDTQLSDCVRLIVESRNALPSMIADLRELTRDKHELAEEVLRLGEENDKMREMLGRVSAVDMGPAGFYCPVCGMVIDDDDSHAPDCALDALGPASVMTALMGRHMTPTRMIFILA